jgi:hypothetical protein
MDRPPSLPDSVESPPGACPCRGEGQHYPGAGERWHDRHRAPTLQRRAVETKRAAHRFSAISMRSLQRSSPGLASNRANRQTVDPLRCKPHSTRETGGLVQVSGRVKRWHGRSTPGAAAVAIDDKGETTKAAQRFTGSIFAVLPVRPVQPAPTHPSPSARQFRLLLNDLATSALRRMFCS